MITREEIVSIAIALIGEEDPNQNLERLPGIQPFSLLDSAPHLLF